MRTKMIIVERGIIILSIYRCDYIEKQIDISMKITISFMN
jgi:hypothetical protein